MNSSCSTTNRLTAEYSAPARRGMCRASIPWMWAMVSIALLAPGPSARAGQFPKPGDGYVAFKSGSYTIEGEEVHIRVLVAREKGFDGPVSVACAISGGGANLKVDGKSALSEVKPGGDAAGNGAGNAAGNAAGNGASEPPRLTWRNADRAPKALSFTVSKKEFFANPKGIEVSLQGTKGARLGETVSLAVIPAGAGEKKGSENPEAGRAVADASNPRRLVLTVREGDAPVAPAAAKTGQAVAGTSPTEDDDSAL